MDPLISRSLRQFEIVGCGLLGYLSGGSKILSSDLAGCSEIRSTCENRHRQGHKRNNKRQEILVLRPETRGRTGGYSSAKIHPGTIAAISPAVSACN